MSAMVTQLSYSINEKLCLDEPTFPAITQQQLHKTEATTVATNKTTTSKSLKFNQKEIGQWSPSVSNGSPPYEASATSSNTEKYMQRNGPSVFGFSLPRHKPQQRSIVFTNRSIKPVALVKAQLNHDNEETTMYDLQENNQKPSRNSFSAVNRFEKWPSPKSTHSTFAVEIPDSTKPNKLINSDQQPDMFPSIVIKSCKLHSPIKSTVTQIFAD
uniref:Uncharacterized protein n=1 Tax=Ciona savignyi TaxID=51511 RepID=H2ZNE2_CIOSA